MRSLQSAKLSSKRAVALLLALVMSSGTAVAVSTPASASTPGTYSVTVKETVSEVTSLKQGVVVKACFTGTNNQWECVNSAESDANGIAVASGITLANSTGYVNFTAGGPGTLFSEAWASSYIIDGAVSWTSDLVLQPTTWVQKTVTAKYSVSNKAVANAQIQLSKSENNWTRTLWSTTNAQGTATFDLDTNIWGTGVATVNLDEVLGLHSSDSETLNFTATPSAELVVDALYTPGTFTVDLKETIAGVDTAVANVTVNACHAGTGNWDCTLTALTNSEGIATFSNATNNGISLPNSTGYVSFTAGGPGTTYSKTWSGQYVVDGVPQWRPYPMYMTSTTWIETKVTTVRSGTLVALKNAQVKLSTPEDGWTRTEYVTTNNLGEATIQLDANHWGGSRVVTAQIESWSGFSSDPTTVTKTVVNGVTTAAVRLVTTSLSYSLSGTITDSNGQPFASKEVCISYWSNQKSSRIDVVTSRTGYYSVEDVTGSSVNFYPGSCNSYEYGTYDWVSGYFYPSDKPATPTHNFQFTKTGVTLTVTDNNGKPAAFLPVQLKDPTFTYGSAHSAVTDQFGVATFTGLNPATSYTAAYKRGQYHYDPLRFADKENSTTVSPGASNRMVNETLVLTPLPGAMETPVTVSGRLVGINGNAISNGKVSIYLYQSSGNNWTNIQTNTTTDSQGRFSISNLPHGSVSLNISANGFRQSYTYFETSPALGNTYNRGDFQMRTEIRGNLSYSGVLRDSEGAPISDMVLVMNRPNGGSIQVKTDPSGGFTFENLTSGWHGIYAQSWYEDYEWNYWNLNMTGTVIDAALTLTSRETFTANLTASISGNVSEYLDVRGPGAKIPVAGACVYAYSWNGGMGGGSASTDANGNWTITGLADGEEYRYHIQDSCTYVPNAPVRFDYQNKYEYPMSENMIVAKNSGGVPGEFLLKEISRSGTGSVSGRVKDADDYSNLAGVPVSISRARGGITIEPVVTDSLGEYSFANLPEGDYYIQIGDYDQKATHYASWMSVEVGKDANRVNALLSKVSTSTLAGSVLGRVFDEFGKPHGSGAVNIWGAEDNTYYGYAYTDNSGDFTIKGLPVGTNLMLSILPQWQELAEFFAEITISTGNSYVVNRIDLKTAATISGSVSGLPSGENAPSVYLYAELINKDNERILQTTFVDPSTGQYVFDRVPEGTFVVRFTQNPFNSGWYDGGYFLGGAEAEVSSVKPVYWNRTQFGTTDFNSAREIEISAGDTRRSINVEVSTGSKLVGTLSVATPDGTSLLTGTREVYVTAYQKRSNGNWLPVATSYISGATKSTFMIAGLSEGSYKLEFYDFRRGNNSLTTSYNGGSSTLEGAPEITVGAGQRVTANHTMTIAPPEKSAAAFDLDDLGAEKLAELKDEIVLDSEAANAGSDLEIFVGVEFAGEFVSAFANSTPVVLSDWQQVNSRGYIKIKIPTTLPAGSHRIAVQDSRSVAVGWAAITITAPATAAAQPAAAPAAAKAKPKVSKSVVEAEPEEAVKESATTEEITAAPAETNSSGDWLLPLAGGFLLIAAVGSAWALRVRRVGVRRK
jgi:hypothetical protein